MLINNSISFICKATSTVSDEENCSTCITWKHNNSENISNSVIVKNNLTIDSILYSHSGNFCCSINETDGSGGLTNGSSRSTESTGLSACSSLTAIGKHYHTSCTVAVTHTTVTIIIVFTSHYIFHTDIEINSAYMQLQVGSTSTINCTVNNHNSGTINWLLQNGSVVNSSGVLTLQPVDYSINGREFTCSLNLSHWPYRINKVITVTIQGKKIKLTNEL